MNRNNYYFVYTLGIVLSFIPITGTVFSTISYGLPFGLLGAAFVLRCIGGNRLFSILVIFSFAISLVGLGVGEGPVINFLFSFVTYAGLAVMLIRFPIENDEDLRRMLRWLVILSFLIGTAEAAIGFIQFYILSGGTLNYLVEMGDSIYGTIYWNCNMFAFKLLITLSISFFGIFMFGGLTSLAFLAGCALQIYAILLASYNSGLAVFLIALFIVVLTTTIVRIRHPLAVFTSLVALVMMVFVVVLLGFLAEQFDIGRYFLARIDDLQLYVGEYMAGDPELRAFRKLIAWEYTIVRLPEIFPYAPILGTGLGSFSSRSALILGGEYIRGDSFLPTSVSIYTDSLILPLWNLFEEQARGIQNQPYSSVQSLYGELGIFFVLFLLWLILSYGFRLVRMIRKDDMMWPLWAVTLLIMLYFSGECFIDNYLEYPHVVIHFILVMKCLGAALTYRETELLRQHSGAMAKPAIA